MGSGIRNGFKNLNFVQLFFDLLIVFIGVYMAFVFSSQREDKVQLKETKRVIALMEVGFELYESTFKNMANYHDDFNKGFKTKIDNNEIPFIADTRYPYPQYPIDVINFVLTKD